MADWFVYDSAAGDNSGQPDWANAAPTLATVDGAAAAGDTIFVASDHSETGATINLDFANSTLANPIKIISADRTSGSPPTTYQNMVGGGGSINPSDAAADLNIDGNIVVYGLSFDVNDKTSFGLTNQYMYFEDCVIDVASDTIGLSNDEFSIEFENCNFITTGNPIQIGNQGLRKYIDCDFSSAAAAGIFSMGTFNGATVLIEDCDLTEEEFIFTGLGGDDCQVLVRKCSLNAATIANPANSPTVVHPDTWMLIESSQAGNNTVPVPGLNKFIGYRGEIEHDAAEFRTGGASNGETPYSWKMTCNTNTVSRHTALKTPPITGWKAASSETLTVYVAHDAVGDGGAGDLQNDECWLEISSPDETDVTTAQGKFQTTKPTTVLAAVGDLVNEGSDQWQDTPTTYQQITATINTSLAEAGPIVVRVCLATGASSIVWVDPKLHFS